MQSKPDDLKMRILYSLPWVHITVFFLLPLWGGAIALLLLPVSIAVLSQF